MKVLGLQKIDLPRFMSETWKVQSFLQKNTLLEIIKIYLFNNSAHFSWTLSCLLSLILDIIVSKIKKKKVKGKEHSKQQIRKVLSNIVGKRYFDVAQFLLVVVPSLKQYYLFRQKSHHFNFFFPDRFNHPKLLLVDSFARKVFISTSLSSSDLYLNVFAQEMNRNHIILNILKS